MVHASIRDADRHCGVIHPLEIFHFLLCHVALKTHPLPQQQRMPLCGFTRCSVYFNNVSTSLHWPLQTRRQYIALNASRALHILHAYIPTAAHLLGCQKSSRGTLKKCQCPNSSINPFGESLPPHRHDESLVRPGPNPRSAELSAKPTPSYSKLILLIKSFYNFPTFPYYVL